MQQTRTRPTTLDAELVDRYRREGFVHVPGVLTLDEVRTYRGAAEHAAATLTDHHGGAIFTQVVNLWEQDETLRSLTLHEGLASRAEQLAGIPLRLWHDQCLIKAPHNGAATEFHQDQPYWPHEGFRHALSAWVALVDVPVERGCMTFIPGSHVGHEGLRRQDLSDHADLFRVAPDLAWEPRVTVPLRAGDCTFHNSYTAHTATPNFTDDPRIAHVVIYVDADVTYTGASHPVTDGHDMTAGAPLPDERFPRLPRGTLP